MYTSVCVVALTHAKHGNGRTVAFTNDSESTLLCSFVAFIA